MSARRESRTRRKLLDRGEVLYHFDLLVLEKPGALTVALDSAERAMNGSYDKFARALYGNMRPDPVFLSKWKKSGPGNTTTRIVQRWWTKDMNRGGTEMTGDDVMKALSRALTVCGWTEVEDDFWFTLPMHHVDIDPPPERRRSSSACGEI
jgi:hypothetical protein